MSAYPGHRETDVLLRDGTTVHIRPAVPEDEELLQDYFMSLSDEARQLRFAGLVLDVKRQSHDEVNVDYLDRLTLLAFMGDNQPRIVGGAQYIREGQGSAEIAMSVSEPFRGRGLASILIAHLAAAASDNGIPFFVARVLPENHAMIDVFRRSGFPIQIHAKPGTIEVEFPTAMGPETVEHYEQRKRAAASEAVAALLEPRSVAVVGASRDPASIGGRILHNLLATPFAGVVHPVNPASRAVQGVEAVARVGDVADGVDVAIVAIPAERVIDVARECGEKGVRVLVVISAGFAEGGGAGQQLEKELLAVCRRSGMRLVGPNCMGVVNTDPRIRLNATFAQAYPPEGNVAFLSQSGALGIAVMNMASMLGLGLSSFVSIGNRADISPNDLLCYWETDDRTDVALLYLESFGNSRQFADIVRRVGLRKPVVVVKGGRSSAGRRAASSHTGALLAASDKTVDALFRQVGVIRTDTLEEMFDAATLLANQPLPTGRNVAVVTNAGGLGIQCADACEAHGLRLPELADSTTDRLRELLPAGAGLANPIDMIASAHGEDYGRVIATVVDDPGVDALIVLYIPPLESDAPDVGRHMVEALGALERRIPVLTCFMSARGLPDALRAPGVRVPSFSFPEHAAIALAHAADYAAWRARPQGTIFRPPDLRPDEAASVLARALEREEGWLRPAEVQQLLACYGLPLVRQRVVETPDDVARSAAELAPTVALKAVGPLHKSDVGAVALDVPAVDAARRAGEMRDALIAAGEALEGFLVQEMVTGGVEMLAGISVDQDLGPVVACGAGGVMVELTRDVAVRLAPLTDRDAVEMVRELACFPLLDGFRGATPKDVRAFEDVILRLSALAADQPTIAELDCNPVTVLDRGAIVVDARVRVQPVTPSPPAIGRVG